MKKCYHYLVSGKVQGVWFRKFTQEQAEMLAIQGWVRNLPDGRVEALACGEEAVLVKFKAQLQQGPEYAQVDEVIEQERAWEDHARFAIL